MINNGQKYIVLDVDDVIVDMSSHWMNLAKEDACIKPYVDKVVGTTPLAEALVLRRAGYMQDWMQLPDDLRVVFDFIYRSNRNFYDDLQPTQFGRNILLALSRPGYVGHVHFITHNFSNDDPSVDSKQRFLETHFGAYMDRCTIHQTDASVSKSKIMERVCPEPHMFADDQMKNVVDVLLNDNVRPHEIAIPEGNFNYPPADNVIKLATLRRIQLNYYNPLATVAVTA